MRAEMAVPAIQSFFETIKNNESIISIHSISDIDFINEELQMSKYYAELLKEYLFENIRLTHFPDKPTRFNCIFLSQLN